MGKHTWGEKEKPVKSIKIEVEDTPSEGTQVTEQELTLSGEEKGESLEVEVTTGEKTYTVTELWNWREFDPKKYEKACKEIKAGKAKAINS